MTVRALLAVVCATFGLLVPFSAIATAQPSPRVSLTTFEADRNRVAALKRGVARMKARKPSDPRSWFYQAAVHAVSSEAIADALSRDPDVANVDQTRFWNQCPHRGQSSADFLIWHRAYLYYFERILREEAGDPALSLPYWNYSVDDPEFPPLFADPDLDPQTRRPRNPLFDFQREGAFMFGFHVLSPMAVSTEAAFDSKEFFGASEEEGFAGGVGDNEPSTKGLIEDAPHDAIHFAVAGLLNDQSGAMGAVATAAFDPIFWVHHANVDRLWAAWECLPDRRWGTVPPDEWLAATPWSFHDADLTVKSLSRRQYLTSRTLAVAYDDADPACRPLSATPPPSRLTDAQPASASPQERQEIGSGRGLVLSAVEPVVRNVALEGGPVLGEPSVRAALTASATSRRLVLELRGIRYTGPPSVGYEVYVSHLTTAENSRGTLVGRLRLFGTVHAGHTGPSTQTFDLTRLALAQSADLTQVRVTIQPFDLLTPRTGSLPPIRRSGNVTLESIVVSVREAGRR